ncbi:hypothetical protein B0T17DRAFT_502752 [Bombardia bombarda]|uniref:Ubiquitin-like protease family profile domain-containing protein n=1 Tax=Bombardia bombarda TaxID=252184 RepID=A0AA40CE68_9PEZI|nr:hypothetical protein B0T17DRAFT_502752 [Bombardia bombarda]
MEVRIPTNAIDVPYENLLGCPGSEAEHVKSSDLGRVHASTLTAKLDQSREPTNRPAANPPSTGPRSKSAASAARAKTAFASDFEVQDAKTTKKSMRGGIRIPMPGRGSYKPPAPRVAVNTLDASRDQSSTVVPSASKDVHPAKRIKPNHYTTSTFTVHDEIMDVDPIPAPSRTSLFGSQDGASSSGPSVALQEYMRSEGGDSRRSNRRHRLPKVPRLHSISPGRDEITEVGDELAAPAHPSTNFPAITLSSREIRNDPADELIKGASLQPKRSHQTLNKGKRRLNHPPNDDVDELSQDSQYEVPKMTAKTVEFSRKRISYAISPRGNITPTSWVQTSGPVESEPGIPVEAAICLPKYRYLTKSGGDSSDESDVFPICHLRPLKGSKGELRAFDDGGSQASQQYNWLKITPKVQGLLHHPESNIIKIEQSSDNNHATGPAMVLRFANPADAASLVRWVQRHLKLSSTRIHQESSNKLESIFEKAEMDVIKARHQNLAKVFSHEATNGKRAGPTGLQRIRTNNPESPEELPFSPARLEPSQVDGPTQSPLLITAPQSSRRLLKDQMNVSEQTSKSSHTETAAPAVSQRSRRSGQIAEDTSPTRSASPPRWSDLEENNQVLENWKMPLVLHRATVDKDDIKRLDEGQFLNDNLIEFSLRHMFMGYSLQHSDLSKRVYLHNSFFYEKLKSTRGKINYDGVKGWTARVNLLAHDYIIVPVNENYHWWVAIICNPGMLDPDAQRRRKTDTAESSKGKEEDLADKVTSDVVTSDLTTDQTGKQALQSPQELAIAELSQLSIDSPREPVNSKPNDVLGNGTKGVVDLATDDKTIVGDVSPSVSKTVKQKRKSSGPPPRKYNPEDPRIITLDSFGNSHSPAVSALRSYLVEEFRDKRNKIINELPAQLGMTAVNIPEQNNFCDCGVYLLGYIQEFLQDPDKFIHTLLRKETPEWTIDPSSLRSEWRQIILNEHRKYQSKQIEVKRKKKQEKTISASQPQTERSALARSGSHDNTSRDSPVIHGVSVANSTSAGPSIADSRAATPEGYKLVDPEGVDAGAVMMHPISWPQVQELSDDELPTPPRKKNKPPQKDTSRFPRVREQGSPLGQDSAQADGTTDEVVLLSEESRKSPKRIIIDDEPKFLEKLPSSSPPPPTASRVKEVSPKGFYGPRAAADTHHQTPVRAPRPTTTRATTPDRRAQNLAVVINKLSPGRHATAKPKESREKHSRYFADASKNSAAVDRAELVWDQQAMIDLT